MTIRKKKTQQHSVFDESLIVKLSSTHTRCAIMSGTQSNYGGTEGKQEQSHNTKLLIITAIRLHKMYEQISRTYR